MLRKLPVLEKVLGLAYFAFLEPPLVDEKRPTYFSDAAAIGKRVGG
jgi:hypothetical protein